MWKWFNCYLSGRHSFGISCEPGAIFLKCYNAAGGRPAGPWIRKATHRLRRHPARSGPPRKRCRPLRRSPSAARCRSAAWPPASLRLTLRARAGDNTRLMAVPRITKEDLKQQLDGGASPCSLMPG